MFRHSINLNTVKVRISYGDIQNEINQMG